MSNDNDILLMDKMEMGELEYRSQIFEAGLQYIDRFTLGEDYKQAARYSRSFWAWWKKRWDDRNRELLERINRKKPLEDASKHLVGFMYSSIHDVEQLDIYVNAVLTRIIHNQSQSI